MRTTKKRVRLVPDPKTVREITKKISIASRNGEKLLLKSLRKELKLCLTEKRRETTNNFNKNLNSILKGNPKQYFNKIKGLFNKKEANGLPKSLKYKDKVYTGKEVLKGFYDLSKDQSINPKRVPGNVPLPYYNIMRDVVNLEKYLLEKTDDTIIKPLDNKGFQKLINKVAKGKAQDINGMAIEHLRSRICKKHC